MNVEHRRAAAALAAVWLLLAPAASVVAQDAPPPPAKSSAPASTKPPVDMDGVLLDDGRQIEGAYEEKAGQRWIIRPQGGGAELNVSVVNVVVAEKGGFLDVKGDDSAAFAVWRAAAQAAYEEKKTAGEEAGKAAQVDVLDKGVAWCRKRDFVTAPTALLNEIGRLLPSKAPELETRAKELIPPSFPFKDKPDAVKQWVKWADALLPSSAVFVSKDEEDNPFGRLENAPWTDGATLCFRSRNTLLFIRDMDPAVCGKALQLAETTCRACQIFLHEGEPDVVSYDENRLEIRIHKSRKDYLEEVPMKGNKPGKKAEAWTAGFYSPLDGVSHFYVDRRATGAPDIEELTRVLSHEFTHHYIDLRWMQGQSGGGDITGFWVVEGMAEFVQNQSHHPERGLRFDDDKVVGVINTARARQAGVTSDYLELSKFMDMTQASFQALSDGPMSGSGGKRIMASERGLWYDQAGALSYFLLQKQGPDVRKRFVQYVYDHYARRSHAPAWKYLGYESMADLEAKFSAFLRTVVGG